MAIVQRVLVKETTLTEGIGAYTLAGAATNFRTFLAAVGSGNQCYYLVNDIGANFEHGLGTVGAGGTLSRDTIKESSNANAAVSWGAGTKNVYLTLPSSGYLLAENNLSDVTTVATARTNLGATSIGASVFTAADAAAIRTLLALGTAATLNVGTGANQIVQLTAAAKYPAVDGSLITNLAYFAATTAMVFYQAAAPTGWTKSTAQSGKALRVVTDSTGGTAGGTVDIASGATEGHTLTVAEMPAHVHDGNPYGFTHYLMAGTGTYALPGAGSAVGTLNSATAPTTGGGGAHTHSINLAYINVIVCTKN